MLSRTVKRIANAPAYVSLPILFAVTFCIFYSSNGAYQINDNCYSLLACESLARASYDLAPYLPDEWEQMPGYDPNTQAPYHFIVLNDLEGNTSYVLYGYPIGSSILSLPIYKLYCAATGRNVLDSFSQYDMLAEAEIQFFIACILASATVIVLCFIASQYLTQSYSLVTALAFGCGSMLWSTCSRGLWAHTWLVLLLAISLLLLNKLFVTRYQGSKLLYLLLGILCFFMYITRPQAIFSIITIYLIITYLSRIGLMLSLLSSGLLFAVYSFWNYALLGQFTYPLVYSSSDIDFLDTGYRLWNLLFSPSRGLFLFCPYLLLSLFVVIAYWKHIPNRVLTIASLGVLLTYIALFSNYRGWHGGYCYGPRYFTDILPWLYLICIQSIAARGSSLQTSRYNFLSKLLLFVFWLLLVWGIAIHYRGANSLQTWQWNYACVTHAEHERHATDWKHPQFLAGITFKVLPDGSFVDR